MPRKTSVSAVKMKKIYPKLDVKSSKNLLKIESRFVCKKCESSRKFFCYKCCIAHPDYNDEIPKVSLPIKIDIIKHKQEVFGKSTSSHAKILAPDDCRIFEYPNIPDYSNEKDVVLIFPSTKSVSISNLFQGVSDADFNYHSRGKGYNIGTMQLENLDTVLSEEVKEKLLDDNDKSYTLDNLPFKRAVFIDSTWKQCRGIYKDPRINSLRSCIIQNRTTKFWRTQKGAPDWYLSTIEAIHQLLLEVHISAWGISQKYYNECLDDLQLDASFIPLNRIIKTGENKNDSDSMCKAYDGQYDNILFFFSFLYSLIHSLDDANGKLNILKLSD